MAEVIPIKSSEFPTLAKRPNFSLLDISSSTSLLDLRPLHWRKELFTILSKLKSIK